MQMNYSPAHYVIHLFGGVRATARAVGKTNGCVGFWKRDKKKGGFGGRIPGIHHKKILLLAKRSGLDITPHDLLYGRKLKTPSR